MRKLLFITALTCSLFVGAAAEASKSVAEMLTIAEKMVSEKHLDEALEQYKTVFGQDPKSTTALFNIGWIYNDQHKYDSAMRWLRKGVELDPQDAKIQNELGFAYSKLGNVDACLGAYSKACQLKPDSAPSWVGLGNAQYEFKKDYPAAATAYLKAVEQGAKGVDVLYRLGWCLNHQGQYTKALPYLKQAADIEPKSAAVWLEWGYGLLLNKQYDEAVQALTRANVIDPKLRLGHLYLGRTYLLMGNKQQARKQVEELKGIDADSARQLEAELKKAGVP